MTDRRIALLRGINVGTAKRIAMGDLRKLFEDLGHADVRTLLNSGNVVFKPAKQRGTSDASRIENEIADRLGVTTRVTVLTGKDLATAIRDNPLTAVADDPARLLLAVVRDRATIARIEPLLEQPWAPEALALRRRIAFLWCAGGIRDSRLWTAVNRAGGDSVTARNLTTMTKLLALAEGC